MAYSTNLQLVSVKISLKNLINSHLYTQSQLHHAMYSQGGISMSHGPASEWKKDNSASVKSKLGISMFILYTLVYAGFVLINVFSPSLMATDIGSLNLAIVYGFGLIIFALILALVYNDFCTKAEKRLNAEAEENKDGGTGK